MQFKILVLFTILLLSIQIKAQSVSYTLPKGYETSIANDDYKKIVDLSVAIIAKKYTIDKVQDGSIYLKPNGDFSVINLHNLINKCTAINDKTQWPDVVTTHFNSMFSSISEQKQLNTNDFESIKKHLSIRVYTEATVQQRGGLDNIIARVDLPGTYTVLMLDLPSAFTPVFKQNSSVWHKTDQELFEIALQNISAVNVEKKTQTLKSNGKDLEVSFIANEDYAASYALDLDHNAPELVGEWGSVVLIPNKGITTLCKISKSHPVDFVNFIQGLYTTADKYYTESAFPVSKQFFWYYKGKFTLIPVTADASGNVNVVAPLALSELLATAK